MKNFYKLLLTLFTVGVILTACENEDENFLRAASLKMVHAASGVPAVHVNYFGIENLDFLTNRTLSFGGDARYTLPAGETRDIRFTYASDTTREVFNQVVNLDPGHIATFFLLGDSANLSSAIIDDVGHRTIQDSLNAIRFINMAKGLESVNVGLADSSVVVASGLSFSDATEFMEFDATLKYPDYTFTFKNQADSVLASYQFTQYRIFDFPGFFFVDVKALRKNISLALVGQVGNEEDSNTLKIVQIDHF